MANSHEDYIAQAPEDLKPLLARLRSELADALPDAEQIIAYKMPGFSVGESIVAGYAAFSKQCGLYVNPKAISNHAEEIADAGLRATKTGVTFSPARPMPDKLVRDLARSSRKALGV